MGNAEVTIGALGTAEGNLALNKTSVVQSGVVQTITDDLQNGTSIGQSMLQLKGTYVAKGWNFDNDWTMQETESYPYMTYQVAPPVIESNLVSGESSISGKSIDGGTVHLYYKGKAEQTADCDATHFWSFTTDALQSGAEVRLYAEKEGFAPSYFTTMTVGYPGKGTETDPYRIYTAADLQGVSNKGYYKVMNDIDLTAWIRENSSTKGWVSIGRNGTEPTYIDGAGHTISGLWTDTTDDYTGLFSNFSAGYIKNLTVEVASGKKVKGGDFTGILIGRIANGQIINCSVKGDVESTEKTLGGVVGAAYNTQISHVDYEGTVNSTSNSRCTGGLAGYTENGSVDNCSVITTINSTFSNVKWYDVGGLIGLTSSAITKSSADVKVTVNGSLQSGTVGGLVGHLAAPGSIYECYTSGSAVAQVESSEAYYNVGGLVGTSHCPISNCYSTADVTGTYFTGGLVGYTYSTVTNCYAKGDVNGVMYGAGLVAELETAEAKVRNGVAANNQLTFTHQSSWASRVIGGYKNGAADPDNSNYALKTMQVTLNGVPTKKYDDLVEGIGKEESVLLTEAFYKSLGWNMTDTWGIDEGTGYPYLLWERETEEPQYVTGDANGDNKVTVLDYLGIAKYILQGAFDGFNAQAADVNGDGKVTVLDYLGVAKIILNGSLNSNHRVNAAALDLSSDCLSADAADGLLTIGLNNVGDYAMFQFDVTLPMGATLVDVEGTERMSSNHTIDFAHQQGTTWRILVGSRSLATVKGSEGDILRLNVNGLTNGEVTIDNAEFVTPAFASTVMRPLCVSVGQPTGISNLLSTSTNEIYNLQGVRVNASQLTPGVYMVNGKKYIVK